MTPSFRYKADAQGHEVALLGQEGKPKKLNK